jgi:hypothetical protein
MRSAYWYIRIWLAVAVGLGALLGVSEYTRNPLHDPDQAQQRTGMLLPAQTYPAPSIVEVPPGGKRTLIFFTRSLKSQHLFHDLADQADLAQEADLVVVTADGSRPMITNGIKSFADDPDGTVAQAFGLNRPVDGGAPIGYVIVDSKGYIRYRTLDPGFMHHTQELRLMLRVTP